MNALEIELEDVAKTYTRGSERVQVLDGLTLSISKGDFVALMGPSGSGKTTILNLIGGLDRPTSGTIRVASLPISNLSDSALSHWRGQNVGYIFQFYNLLPMLSARENVELPLLLSGLNAKQRRSRAEIALKLVGLEDRMGHRPQQLSGGQQQRVAIARAVVQDPEILICDEPTGDLDRVSGDAILQLLGELNSSLGKTIVMVTHDPRAAEQAARIVHLDKGKIGTPP